MQALVRTEEGGYSNLVLKSQLARFGGTAQERAFAAAVFYGTVERKNTLDYCLGKFLQKPLSRCRSGSFLTRHRKGHLFHRLLR